MTGESITKRLENALDRLLSTRLMTIKTKIAAFDVSKNDPIYLDQSLQTLRELQIEYHQKAEELIGLLADDLVDERVSRISDFDDICDNTIVRIKRIKLNLEPKKQTPDPNGPSAPIRLPDIPLPVFNGNVSEWVYFREKFTALIIENKSLTDFQRLHYLKAALRDEAATLQSPNDSFASLWTALKERFEIKRLIADNHINEIFQLKPIRHESASDLRNLLDVVMKNLRVLNTIGLPLDDLSEAMLINLLCNRLDADTRKAYELQLKVQTFPKWNDMMCFLKSRCHILESIEKSSPVKPSPVRIATQYTNKQPAPRFSQPKVNALASTSNNYNNNNRCSLCSQPHFLSQCPEFLKMNPDGRFSAVKK
jgi:Protein of unknown function (DUF1759)